MPIIRKTYYIYATLVFFALYGWLSETDRQIISALFAQKFEILSNSKSLYQNLVKPSAILLELVYADSNR